MMAVTDECSSATSAAGASSPASLILRTEQTRDWEKGERAGILAGLRAYSKWAGLLMLVTVPVFFVAMPWLIRIVFGQQYEDSATAARIGSSSPPMVWPTSG